MCSHTFACVNSIISPVYSTTKCRLCPGFSYHGVRQHARAPHTTLHHTRTRECYLTVCSSSPIYLNLIDFGIILQLFMFTPNLNVPGWLRHEHVSPAFDDACQRKSLPRVFGYTLRQVTDCDGTFDIKDAAAPLSTDAPPPRSAHHPEDKKEDYGEILSVSVRPSRSLS